VFLSLFLGAAAPSQKCGQTQKSGQVFVDFFGGVLFCGFFRGRKKADKRARLQPNPSIQSVWLQFFQIKRPVDSFARLSEKKADKRAGLQPELVFAAYPRCPVFLMRHRRLISTCQSICSVRRVIYEVKSH
jgi:hypothetical protein